MSEQTAALTEMWQWEKDTRMFCSGHILRVGKWRVGGVSWASRSKGDTAHYQATSALPGIKEHLGYFETEGEAREKVERATRHWLRGLEHRRNNSNGAGDK